MYFVSIFGVDSSRDKKKMHEKVCLNFWPVLYMDMYGKSDET